MSKKLQRKALAAAKKGKKIEGVKSVSSRSSRPVYIPRVERPFAGLEHEVELAAMRELIPAATLSVHTTPEYGDTDVLLVSVAPQQAQAVRTQDGRIMVALQTSASTGDASHDLGLALSKVLETDEPTVVAGVDVRAEAPRLQDMISREGNFSVYENFEYWLDPSEERTPEIERALQESQDALIPTRQIEGVRGAFWCQFTNQFVRWVRSEDEDQVLNGIARLLARKECVLTEGSRCIGAFRMLGLLTPVWQLAEDTSFEQVADAVRSFDAVLSEAIADSTPLTAEERRARDGFISRQVSLR